MVVLFLAGVVIEFGYISAIPMATELRPRARARTLSLLVVSTSLGRVAADLVAPRVFATGGMRPVTLMAGIVAMAALLVVLFGVREVESATQDEASVS
jgi:predicted MFS family arabinose efflux permease